MDEVLVGIKSGHQRDERRTADARGEVSVRETGRLRGEAVEIGRMDRLVAHEAIVRPGLVVGDDINDVGTLGGSA